MDVERRSVLGGLAALGLSGVASGPADSAATAPAAHPRLPARPTLVLVNSAAERSGFLEGVAASPDAEILGTVRTDCSLGLVNHVRQALQAKSPIRVIGLIDDASSAFIVGLARSTGARQQWLANHWASLRQSRHSILSADVAQGCAGALGQYLNRCGSRFAMEERNPPGTQPFLTMGGGARDLAAAEAARWPAVLGYLLASLGRDGAPGFRPAGPMGGIPPTGYFVSISLES